jgi:5,10-methylenetetrahydrofolate reductase
MTQPVFDVRLIKTMEERTKHLRVPIFTGVWPLLSAKQAEFLHHEVAGIIVPDELRTAIGKVEESAARARAARMAEEMIAAALDYFPGVYLITPFLHYEITAELAKFARAV